MHIARYGLALLLLLTTMILPARAADVLESESLGGVKQGTSVAQVAKKLGQPQSKSAVVLEPATGLYVQTWKWPQLSIKFASPKKGGPLTVDAIDTSRASLSTARGIHVGSRAEDVRKAYAALIDASSTNSSQIVVGSVYGGLIFTVQKGKVTRIFLGPAAE